MDWACDTRPIGLQRPEEMPGRVYDTRNNCWAKIPELTPETRAQRPMPNTPSFEAYLDNYLAKSLKIKTEMRKGQTLLGGGGSTISVETKLILNGKVISTSSDYRRID